MDSQIYKISGDLEDSKDILPTMKYVIKVVSKMNSVYVSNQKREEFLNDINLWDIILLEIPPILESSFSHPGIKSIKTKVTNLRNNKSIIIPGKRIDEFWDTLKEIQVIDHGNI